jgi:hypothetical protein
MHLNIRTGISYYLRGLTVWSALHIFKSLPYIYIYDIIYICSLCGTYVNVYIHRGIFIFCIQMRIQLYNYDFDIIRQTDV